MDPRYITPVLITALIVWGLYRRARRFIGRQPLQPGRLKTRVVIFSIIGLLLLVTTARETAAALLAGGCLGAALGWLGLKYTRFETTPEGRFYTPHAYIGLIVAAVLVGRLLYRFVILYSGTHGFAAFDPGAGPNAFAAAGPPGASGPYAFQNPYGGLKTPLTYVIFGVLVGYYIAYFSGVLSKSSQMPALPEHTSGAE